MFKKIIFATVLIAFIGMQMASSLQCWHCTSPKACLRPDKAFCNQRTANATRTVLGHYFKHVPNTTTNNFDCIFLNYTHTSPLVVMAGCIYREVKTCQLRLENEDVDTALTHRNCTQCGKNLCNGHNPAAAATVSLYTLISSIAGVMIAKVLSY